MSHRNARLTVHGHLLLVERVRVQGMAIAHVAKAIGISRQCVHRWVARFDAEGAPVLADRSSRPHRSPTRTAPEVERAVLDVRAEHHRGQDWIGPELEVPDPAPPPGVVPARVRPAGRAGDPCVEGHRGALPVGPPRRAGAHGR